MIINIRPATIFDIDRIYEIEQLCFDKIDQFDKDYFYLFLMKRRGEIFLVATNEEYQREVIVGFIVAALNAKTNYEITTLNVHPGYRQKGIGTKLMFSLEDEIVKNLSKINDLNYITIELIVYENNHDAKALYKKLGYIEVGLVKNYYRKQRHGLKMSKKIKLK